MPTAAEILRRRREHPNRRAWLNPWYQTDPSRLVLEQQIMSTKYPQFVLKKDGVTLYWIGTLQTNNGGIYEVAVDYPDDFPENEPAVVPINPPIVSPRHQFRDGRLCLFYPADRSFNPNTTAATLVTWTAAWLFCYENFTRTGKWLGAEAD